jgi:hypothetical protein
MYYVVPHLSVYDCDVALDAQVAEKARIKQQHGDDDLPAYPPGTTCSVGNIQMCSCVCIYMYTTLPRYDLECASIL